MARKIITHLTSDLSGTEADETITFSIDGRFHRIDLTTDEAHEFREHLAQYAAKGERLSKQEAMKTTKASPTAKEREERTNMRAWAKDHGYDIGDRGRISTEIREAYASAHS